MQTEQKKENPPKKMGRPPMAATPKPAMSITVEGDEVVIRLPKKDFTRKLLAELI